MIMLPHLCRFWVHINVVLCNDSEKIFPGISGKYAIIIKFLTMETAILLHISRHLSYDMQMPRRNSFWIIFFALMVISFNPTYNYNGVSRFSRCLRFANEISLVCTILDSFLYENIISWETDRAAWLTLVGVGSAPINKQWTQTQKRKWGGFLLTIDQETSLKRRTTFSSAFAREDWFVSFNLFFTRWSIFCEYVIVFLRSSFWSLISGRASSKRSVNRETCGETGILSDLRSSLYMNCNSVTTKEHFPCMLHCFFTKCIIFRKSNSSKKFSDGLSGVVVSCFIAAIFIVKSH